MVAAGLPGSRLLVGASLAGDSDTPTALVESVETRTVTHTRAALPLLRELVAQRRLSHDGGADLAAQVDRLLVSKTSGGLTVSTRSGRTDLARAVPWAVAEAVRAPEPALELSSIDGPGNRNSGEPRARLASCHRSTFWEAGHAFNHQRK